MPYVRVEITDGATTEQKRAISKGITDVLVKVLNKNPEYTFVVIDEVDSDNWGHKGVLVSDIRKQEAKAAAKKPPKVVKVKLKAKAAKPTTKKA
ncbi:MAG: 4-oxalocrotonate tautomerase [Devosia sp.]|uniref:tautomerase family protein n=1 Tax=Devosia sp. TaxID=1871048 RepID=UPI002A6DA91A|nr:4-oxalocrotonate tautomerase [Devosia sp.]